MRLATANANDRRPLALLVLLAVMAATWALIGSATVFPYTSGNGDEGVYLLQADTLRHGRLFPPAPSEQTDAFKPYFTRQRGDQFVPKYAPVHAALIAVGGILAGSYRAALAMIAVGAVIATFLLAEEVLRSRREALLASAFLLGSPLFLIQSITYLPYLSALILLELFAFALLRALRTDRRSWFVVGGFIWGVAFFARSYDALLCAAPMGALLLLRRRRELPRLAGDVACLALGAMLPLTAYLGFNAAATGKPLQPPFTLDPTDTLGFGRHRILPGAPYFNYTPREGLLALRDYLATTSFWIFGGIPGAGLAVWALVSKRSPRLLALAGIVVAIPLGYFFFWGMTVSSTISAGIRYLGPWYYMPLLGPILILAAAGFTMLWRRDRLIALLALAGMVGISAFTTGRGVWINARVVDSDRAFNRALAGELPRDSLVFVPGDELLVPFRTARNPTLDGPVLFAIDRGPADNLAVSAAFPERRPFGIAFDPPADGRHPASRLQPLEVISGPVLELPLTLGRLPQDAVLSVEWRSQRLDCAIASDSMAITLGPTGISCSGSGNTSLGRTELPSDFVFVTITSGPRNRPVYRWTAAAEVADGRVFLTPPLRADRNSLLGGSGVGKPRPLS